WRRCGPVFQLAWRTLWSGHRAHRRSHLWAYGDLSRQPVDGDPGPRPLQPIESGVRTVDLVVVERDVTWTEFGYRRLARKLLAKRQALGFASLIDGAGVDDKAAQDEIVRAARTIRVGRQVIEGGLPARDIVVGWQGWTKRRGVRGVHRLGRQPLLCEHA